MHRQRLYALCRHFNTSSVSSGEIWRALTAPEVWGTGESYTERPRYAGGSEVDDLTVYPSDCLRCLCCDVIVVC